MNTFSYSLVLLLTLTRAPKYNVFITKYLDLLHSPGPLVSVGLVCVSHNGTLQLLMRTWLALVVNRVGNLCSYHTVIHRTKAHKKDTTELNKCLSLSHLALTKKLGPLHQIT